MALAFLQAATDTTDLTIYNFASQNFGTAAIDRYIVVAITARRSGSTTSVIGVTIGGVAATLYQVTNHATNTTVACIAVALVPLGTSGTISVTFGLGMVRCAIGVYRMDNIVSIIPTDTDSSTANDPTVNLDVPFGCAIGAAATGTGATGTTWTGLTEDYDALVESSQRYTGASSAFLSAQSGRSITADFSSSLESVGVFASWEFNPSLSTFVPRVTII